MMNRIVGYDFWRSKMGLDIENDAGILKHYNVTNVEKSPCLIENTTSNSKIIIFKIK